MLKQILIVPIVALLASFSFADHHEEVDAGPSAEELIIFVQNINFAR